MKTLLYSLITITAVIGCFTLFACKTTSTSLQKYPSGQTTSLQVQRDNEKPIRKDKNCRCCKKLSLRDKFRQRAQEAQERRRKLAEQRLSQIGAFGANTLASDSKN